jgi:WD40 repeat protein
VSFVTMPAERWPSTLTAIGTIAAVRGVTVSADLPGTIDRIAFESDRNGNVDIYAIDGANLHRLTTNPGADNTPRFSPDNRWTSFLSMERAGFEADRLRLMIADRSTGMGPIVDATAGWALSVGDFGRGIRRKCD